MANSRRFIQYEPGTGSAPEHAGPRSRTITAEPVPPRNHSNQADPSTVKGTGSSRNDDHTSGATEQEAREAIDHHTRKTRLSTAHKPLFEANKRRAREAEKEIAAHEKAASFLKKALYSMDNVPKEIRKQLTSREGWTPMDRDGKPMMIGGVQARLQRTPDDGVSIGLSRKGKLINAKKLDDSHKHHINSLNNALSHRQQHLIRRQLGQPAGSETWARAKDFLSGAGGQIALQLATPMVGAKLLGPAVGGTLGMFAPQLLAGHFSGNKGPIMPGKQVEAHPAGIK